MFRRGSSRRIMAFRASMIDLSSAASFTDHWRGPVDAGDADPIACAAMARPPTVTRGWRSPLTHAFGGLQTLPISERPSLASDSFG